MERNKQKGKIGTAICAGFAAAVIFGAANADGGTAREQTFLFPQFCKAAAADRSSAKQGNDDKIVYSFKLAELFEKWFM